MNDKLNAVTKAVSDSLECIERWLQHNKLEISYVESELIPFKTKIKFICVIQY